MAGQREQPCIIVILFVFLTGLMCVAVDIIGIVVLAGQRTLARPVAMSVSISVDYKYSLF